jgi:putative DNA primase/helicase
MDNTTTQSTLEPQQPIIEPPQTIIEPRLGKIYSDSILAEIESFSKPAEVKVLAHEEILNAILETIEPIDFWAVAAVGDKLLQKRVLVACIEELLRKVKEQNFGLTRKDDFVFAYNGAFWKELDRELIKNFLGHVAIRMSVNNFESKHYEFKDKLYRQFLAAAYFEPIHQDTDVVLLNALNGTIEITKDTHKVRAFNRDDFLTYQLPFEYAPAATCPMFQKYLDRVLPEKETQNIIAEFFGYVFTKNLKMEKAMLLYGSGGNGKSVIFDVMNALLGKENLANFSLSNLLEEHNRALIANKLLNYGSEINAAKTRDEFKNLVSGEPIQARLKYGQSFTMTNYAKLAFNCNELPKDFDHTNAYFRRLLIIPFRETIPESEQDKTFAVKIIKTELAGVFNWIVDGLKRLLKAEKFTESKIVKQTIETYRKESDSVAMFIDDKGYKPSSTNYIFLKTLYANYRTFCLEDGSSVLKRINFKRRLEALGFRTLEVSNLVRVYLESEADNEPDNETDLGF